MTNFVKARFDVAFQYPLRRSFVGKRIEESVDGVGGAAFGPEPVAVMIGHRFRDRFECKLV